MAFDLAQATKLCSVTELGYFSASLDAAVSELSAAQLRSRIARVRTLRDKSADLFRRQTISTREATGSKRGEAGAANQRTEQKRRLFDETLKRFETRLATLEAQAAKAAAAPRKSPTRAAVARPAAQPAVPKKSVVRRAAAKGVEPLETRPAAKAALAGPAQAPRARRRAPKLPAPSRGNPVSAVVKVRAKQMGAHVRAAGARAQAKRNAR